MKPKYTVAIIIVMILLSTNSFYIVDETEQVIITQFGNPVGNPVNTAGLKFKLPFIQKVHYFEKRLLEWDGDPKQIPTSDKRYLWVDTFARWRIIDPLTFYETTRNELYAHGKLDDIISGTARDIISTNMLIDIVRNTNRELAYTEEYYAAIEEALLIDISTGREAIAKAILELSKPSLLNLGIELVDVQVKRVNYIEEVRKKVYDRMNSERYKIAEKYRSAGKGKAAEITGKMQKELDKIQSEAYRTAQEIIGEADATAAKIYADSYGKDPEFYEFIKTLETYKNTLNEKNTMIMSTDSEFYKFLKSSSGK